MAQYTPVPAPIPAPPAPKRRPSWLIAAVAAVATAAAAVGVTLALTGGDDEGPADPVASGSPGASASSTDEAGAEGEGEPLTAAPETAWVAESGVQVPVSEQFGPADVDEAGVPSGFAHSPEGALLAAAQITARTGAAFDPAVREAVVAACVTGEETDVAAFADAVAEADPISAAEAALIAGFDYLAYNPDEALIELAMDAGIEGMYAAFRITVVWTGDDWALQVPTNGDWNTAVRPVENLDAFVPWGP